VRTLSFFLLFFFSFQLPLHAKQASAIGTESGQYAPTFELSDLAGGTISLESLRSQVVLLNFWSTLCAPCMAEMPSLNRLSSALRDKGLQVISVAIDPNDKPVREYVQKNAISFTVLLDRDKAVFFDDYAGPSLPATYLLDRNGIIVDKFNGPQVWDAPEMKNKIMMLLEKK
jgi:peroxiredoxin